MAFGLVLSFTLSHAQNGERQPTMANNPTPNTPDCNDKPATAPTLATGSKPPKSNITVNDLINVLMQIKKNQGSTTAKPNYGNPVTDSSVPPANPTTTVNPTSPTNPTTSNPEIITDIVNRGSNANQSIIILAIGDLLGTQLGGNKEPPILNALNGINCQQGYIYVLLPGGQGKFVPLNQANALPQNGVPSYIILLANGPTNILQNPNWQQINGLLPNLGINIPGLSQIGSIPIYAPTNSFNPGLNDPNAKQPSPYPATNPNFPMNTNNVVNDGVEQPAQPSYPIFNNPNFGQQPVQPPDTSNNWNIPGINVNVPAPTPQPLNPGISYPNINFIQQPSQKPLMPNGIPNVNNPIFTVNFPNQPNVPAPAPRPLNPGISYPNINVVQQPSQQPLVPNLVPNINNPTFTVNYPNQPNVVAPTPQPINPNINYPNINVVQQPSQVPLMPNVVPNINNPTITVNVPNQPQQPINWPSQSPVNPDVTFVFPTQQSPTPQRPPINVPGIGINFPIAPTPPTNTAINIPIKGPNMPSQTITHPTQYPSVIDINDPNLVNLLKLLVTQSNSDQPNQSGFNPNYIVSVISNLLTQVPNQVGNNEGVKYPTVNIPGSTTSNVKIDVSKILALLGLKLGNVPNGVDTKINIPNLDKWPNINQQQNIPESELLSILLKQLGNGAFNGKSLNDDRVKITIEKGQGESKQTVPNLTNMLLHYINRNTGPSFTDNRRNPVVIEDNRQNNPDVLFQFLSKTPNVVNNPQIVPSVVPTSVQNVPVVHFQLLGQSNPNLNGGNTNYIPNVPMSIPNNGIVPGQVAIDPQYLATLMKTFSNVNLPNNYFPTQNNGVDSRAPLNNMMWSYLLTHLGCIPNDQPNYAPNNGKIIVSNQIPTSNWAQVPQFYNTGISFRKKRAAAKKP